LAGVGFLVYQGQYYVGVDKDNHVAAFQGVQGNLFGMTLSKVEVSSDTPLSDLTPAARSKVKQGIPANGREDAMRILQQVTTGESNLLEPCPQPSSPSPSKTSDKPSGSASSSKPHSSKSGSPSDKTSSPSDGATSPSPKPGVDCRQTD
ncbi:MAG TPA: protein phosphatase, partial [Stackebrandtia sp.]|nr:protein phosphatase [Stackebrandtia sp.]